VRFNIASIDEAEKHAESYAHLVPHDTVQGESGSDDARIRRERILETAASWCLAFAYIISVGYYLNLFGAFAVSLTPFDNKTAAKVVTSAIFLLILVVGWFWGFKALERMEQLSVGVKLAIITGLLVGLADYFRRQVLADQMVFGDPTIHGWEAIFTAFGLIVTVQGFETSRYLEESYDARTRIRSMRLAQALSTLIYMAYIGLIAYVFAPSEVELTETSIIDMMRVVAPILPGLLVAAALSAQFSAAVADTSGSGGLLTELTGGKLSPRKSYALLVGLGLALTWTANLFEIISYASRAFAAYYALQSLLAAVTAWDRRGEISLGKLRAASVMALAALGVAIAVLGIPVE